MVGTRFLWRYYRTGQTMSDSYFYELKTPSILATELLNIARNAPESQWEVLREQNLIFIDRSVVIKDPTLSAIIDRYDPGKRIMIFRSFPNDAYNWHRDAARVGSINMRLCGPDSITLMGKIGTKNRHHLEDIHAVPFKDNHLYLMNVSQLHSVFNYGNEMRYMFSLSVGLTDDGSPTTDFPAILDFIKTSNL
jgi:hypothetical protein